MPGLPGTGSAVATSSLGGSGVGSGVVLRVGLGVVSATDFLGVGDGRGVGVDAAVSCSTGGTSFLAGFFGVGEGAAAALLALTCSWAFFIQAGCADALDDAVVCDVDGSAARKGFVGGGTVPC